MDSGAVDIFSYRDYRAYLKDWFNDIKQKKHSYSFRVLARRAGFQSSNFVLLVMQGKRNLTQESVRKLAIGLDLGKRQEEFFRDLVFFNQAKKHDEKNHYYKLLLQCQRLHHLKPMEQDQYEYYSEWYHPVVRELICSRRFDGTPAWVAARIVPRISPEQAERSIALLEKLKFIERDESGHWRLARSIISTGDELTSVVVHNYHKKLLDLTKEKMDSLASPEKDVSAMTLGIRIEQLPELRKKIRDFRKEILTMVADENDPETVVQFNMQMYSVADVGKKKGAAQ